jgi:hypothetical protein
VSRFSLEEARGGVAEISHIERQYTMLPQNRGGNNSLYHKIQQKG